MSDIRMMQEGSYYAPREAPRPKLEDILRILDERKKQATLEDLMRAFENSIPPREQVDHRMIMETQQQAMPQDMVHRPVPLMEMLAR